MKTISQQASAMTNGKRADPKKVGNLPLTHTPQPRDSAMPLPALLVMRFMHDQKLLEKGRGKKNVNVECKTCQPAEREKFRKSSRLLEKLNCCLRGPYFVHPLSLSDWDVCCRRQLGRARGAE